MKTRLVIRNLPLEIKERDLKRLVGKFGMIKSTYVARDPKQFDLAFAEVLMTREDEAETAARGLRDLLWHGNFLETKLAEEDWE